MTLSHILAEHMLEGLCISDMAISEAEVQRGSGLVIEFYFDKGIISSFSSITERDDAACFDINVLSVAPKV